ncbi:hypothetical protein D3C78_1649270 [compost metagenome]
MQAEVLAQLAGIQPGVVWALGRGGVGAGRYGDDLLHGQGFAQLVRLLDDEAGVTVPRGFARCGQVIQAGQFRFGHSAVQGMGTDVGE